MKTKTGSFLKRGIAAGMMAVMAFMLPATPLHETQVQAAEVRSTGEFIKEVRLFVKQDGTASDAEAWCASKGDGWKVLKGDQDGNLNSGADAVFTEKYGVFFCYQTTTDPDEAITDLAVMNENGNYSASDYKILLDKQKEAYIDMVKNMKTMLEEYRKNYQNKVPMAVKSHDFLNAYKEDKSGELLGDLLLTVSDDNLAEILLQCNGTVVLAMQEKLAAACDTAKTTWLDRLSKLGSFDKLKNAFSQNIKSGDVEKAMERQYRETASKLLDRWDDLSKRINNLNKFLSDNGLSDATEDQIKDWVSKLEVTDDAYASYQEYLTLISLAGYKYGDKTLLNFFAKTKDQIEKDGIETLYPMAASFTKGQLAALDESTGLFQMVRDALGATVVNDNNAGIMAQVKKDTEGAKMIKENQEVIDEVDKIIETIGEDKISVYEGVDREVFDGGVAVTTDAKSASSGSESSWSSLFVKDGNVLQPCTIALGTGAVVTAVLAGVFSRFMTTKTVEKGLPVKDAISQILADNKSMIADSNTRSVVRLAQSYDALIEGTKKSAEKGQAYYKSALRTLEEGAKDKTIITRSNLYTGLTIGMTVFTILMAGADIAMNIIALHKYYNKEHIEIPHHIVDMKYSETSEASFVAYRSVRDQDDRCGDLNAGSCKQWLALYYTKDKNAGAPLLAPTENGNELVVKVGTDAAPGTGYSPLHMFGTVNTAQNLTFADGESGYSYNDKNGGTYLYFSHANTVVTYTDKKDDTGAALNEDEAETVTGSAVADATQPDDQSKSEAEASASQTGTVLGGGTLLLVGIVGVVAGGFGGFVIASRRRKHPMER